MSPPPVAPMPIRVLDRYAAETKLAEDLTKGWLLKVKKLWNDTLKNNWSAYKTFQTLEYLVKGLREQVVFQRQGYNTKHDFFALRRKMEAAVEKVLHEIQVKSAEYEKLNNEHTHASYAVQDARLKIEDETGDRLQKLGPEEYFAKHPEVKPLKEKEDALYDRLKPFSYGHLVKTLAPVTRHFDELMKILYEDAADLADARSKGVDVADKTADRVFDIYGMKVIVIDPELTATDVRKYIGFIDQAYAELSRKKLTQAVWKGKCFIDLGKNKVYTPEEMEFRKQWGYTNDGEAAHYLYGKDEIHLTMPATNHVAYTIVHEMGHRYWFKVMTPEQRAVFNNLVRTKETVHKRDFPQGPTDDEGYKKPVAPLNDYASSNIEEAFAEVFEAFVMGGELDRDQLESFKSVLQHKFASITARVLARYLAAGSTFACVDQNHADSAHSSGV